MQRTAHGLEETHALPHRQITHTSTPTNLPQPRYQHHAPRSVHESRKQRQHQAAALPAWTTKPRKNFPRNGRTRRSNQELRAVEGTSLPTDSKSARACFIHTRKGTEKTVREPPGLLTVLPPSLYFLTYSRTHAPREFKRRIRLALCFRTGSVPSSCTQHSAPVRNAS